MNKDSRENDIEIFKIVTDHFKKDVSEYWVRANFYLIAHAGLFSAFAATYSRETKGMVIIAIPIVGFIMAIFWFLVLRGAVKWIQRWREQVMLLDREIDRFQCYIRVEEFARQKPFLSPSYVTQFLPLTFMIIWLLILILILAGF